MPDNDQTNPRLEEFVSSFVDVLTEIKHSDAQARNRKINQIIALLDKEVAASDEVFPVEVRQGLMMLLIKATN